MSFKDYLIYIILIAVLIIAFVANLHEIDAQSKELDKKIEYTIESEESETEEMESEIEALESETESETLKACVYTTEDYEILAHVINGEAESNSYQLKLDVGSVVLNRMNDPRFPNTIAGVVFQEGQYACTWDGNYDKTPVQDSYDAALELLENGSQLPAEIVWQANHCQGEIYSYYENTYFCS